MYNSMLFKDFHCLGIAFRQKPFALEFWNKSYGDGTHLQVGWVFIILIGRNLKFLLNPFFQLLGISLEKLESIGIFKLLAPQG